MKKTLSVLLCSVVLSGQVPVRAWAQEPDFLRAEKARDHMREFFDGVLPPDAI